MKSEWTTFIQCPFCGECDFDKTGFKSHLVGGVFYEGCQKFKEQK